MKKQKRSLLCDCNIMRYGVLLFLVILHLAGKAQSTAGITGKPDTSYTNYSAYISTKRTHPEIRIVKEFHSRSAKENRSLVYCSIAKRKLLLDAFYPSESTNQLRPAIIIIHGGGWRSGSRTQHHPLAQRLAGLGYVCFTPEYRLSTEALYPAAVNDLKAAIRWVHSEAIKFSIDTAKIVVLGFSAGGELAAFLGTTMGQQTFEGKNCNLDFSSNVQAVVDIDGILSFVHPESGEGDDSKKTSAATYWFGFSKKDNPLLWEEASSLTQLNKHIPPTLFINSSVARMHAGRDDYIKYLRANNIYSEVKTFENAPHSFCLFDPWFQPTVSYIDDFLQKVFSTAK